MSNRYFADVSNNNTQHMNFEAYRDQGGHLLIGHKATEGTGFIDAFHAERSARSHKAGCWVAHYHFGHPGRSASEQARFFWQQVGPHFTGKDFAVLDIEVTDGQRRSPAFMQEMAQLNLSALSISQWVRAFTEEFKRVSGHTLVGYSGESFLKDIGYSGIKRWWVAKYGPPPVRTPAHADVWAWQFTDGQIGPEPHECAGIGHCDVSTLNVWTYNRLRFAKRPR